ncbi:TPA: hypothetical protein I3769_001114 [Enterobacter cloacae]|uniref:Uncharacterized protein n=5 Tax=Enterobacter TaxID=547 RepID=A0A0H3ZHP9_ENTCL|nr:MULTISPECIES: ABC-three component system middle component 5 [Enterobacteriaceae]AKN35433.1 hypothetical protein [Enterobacter cloacae]QKN22994.1 hypothetical protein [Enterobacter cloacae complex sp.]HDT4185265.1 hypothetical protein [Klebsiella pneumoniae subsp. pneumoniae]AOW71464.1 hypothetical protein [Enterobacter cloacae]EKX8547312.1 hypothetical protein [Enterobacter bugandensis]
MLIYHPIFDTSHCVYRSLLLLEEQNDCEIDIELFRLMDFYVLFPSLLKLIKPFPNELRRYKKAIQKISEPYENIQNPNRIFIELRRIQSIAFHHLLSKNLIDMESYTNGKIKRTKTVLPEDLKHSLSEVSYRKSEWFALISKGFQQIEFYGSNGLKKRTGLMEYRYDEVDTND